MQIPAAQILETRVVMTIIGGEVVHAEKPSPRPSAGSGTGSATR
jgi:hypothetical protein